jgi:hypothetical protein
MVEESESPPPLKENPVIGHDPETVTPTYNAHNLFA